MTKRLLECALTVDRGADDQLGCVEADGFGVWTAEKRGQNRHVIDRRPSEERHVVRLTVIQERKKAL